jgi:hypothetical protein
MPITPLGPKAVAGTRRESKVRDFGKLGLARARAMLIKVEPACLIEEAS